jgi:hypothetical protein
MFVFPDSHISGGNAPLVRNRGGFDHDQRDASKCPGAKVHKMEIRGKAILRRVHAQRRHRYAVAERYATDGKRGQQVNFRNLPIVPAVALGMDGPCRHASGPRCPGGNLGYFGHRGQGDSRIVQLAQGGPVLPFAISAAISVFVILGHDPSFIEERLPILLILQIFRCSVM